MSGPAGQVNVEVHSPTGQLVTSLPVDASNAGEVTSDRTAETRWTISSPIRVVDPTGLLIPRLATDILHPYSNNELWLSRLDRNGNLIALGKYAMTGPTIHVGNDGWWIDVNGADRSLKLQRAAWTDLYSIAAGTSLDSAVLAMLQNRMTAAGIPLSGPGSWPFNLAPNGYTVPDTTFGIAAGASSSAAASYYTTDPWADAQGLFADAGQELFVDAAGTVVGQPIPIPGNASPAATYVDGVGGTVVTVERAVNLDNTYSGVIVIGTGSTVPTPIVATVWDPTAQNLIGEVPYIYRTSTITSQSQANQVAAAMLPTVVGAQETVTVTAWDDPQRAASDVIRVVSSRAGVDANYLVQTVSHQLTVNATMQITATRQVPPS